MKIWLRIGGGAVLLLVGALWLAQGAGAVSGSAMSGHAQWSVIGLLLVVVGVFLLLTGVRRQRSGARH